MNNERDKKEDKENGDKEDKKDRDLTITIETTEGAWTETFAQTDKIKEVIAAVVRHFVFAADGKYELRRETDPDTPLDPERPLVSYHIKDGDTLIFTDLGIAV